ncbi:hypothetical protein ACFS5N_07570 [Mucilaginibacter ximonensis]|uniref:Uncharacterized protein n=1 Tax=Mucilaginibacter ximonensis TaxID=538021 RepID=A0ABW5YAG8_9SPHI
MKIVIALILIGINTIQNGYDLIAIRTAYVAAATHKSGLLHLKKILAAAPADPLINCYRGAAEMIEAKYALNPLNKLSAFDKGKQLIEQAIAADSDNVECRFIRYGIQRNLPAVLSYHSHLKNDSTLINNRLDTITDQDLKKRIINFIKRG